MSAHHHDISGAIPDEAYVIIAEFKARPGLEEELRNTTLPLVAQARSEPNTLLFFLHEDREAPGHFIFYEVYARQSDFEAHGERPHMRTWFAGLPGLVEGGLRVVRMEILGARRP